MIRKILIVVIILSWLLPAAFATPLRLEKIDKGSVLISELNNPAVFDFVIDNLDGEQQAEIYSFVGVNFIPAGFFNLSGGNNTIEVKVYPNEGIREKYKGAFNFEYQIKGDTSGITKDTLTIKIVSLKDLLDISAINFELGNNKIVVKVKNTQNTSLVDVKLNFSSLFFNEMKTLSFSPYESVDLTLDVDKDKIKSLTSGSYVFSTEVMLQNASVNVESTFNYILKEDSVLSKSGEGFIIRKVIYTRENTGNAIINGKIEITKNVLSRLFTINSAEPIQVNRQSFFATYVWEKSLKPGEIYSITSTTNYTFPFILILMIVVVALLVKMYTRTNLIIVKRVSYVKTKGGEFALKVKLHIKAKKYIENVQIIDKLPGMTKLYEKFGIMPDKVDQATRRLFWNIDRLNAGEERVYSYIVYSKVRVVGKFELPAVTATYLREGKTEQVFSNRTFFVAETMRTDLY